LRSGSRRREELDRLTRELADVEARIGAERQAAVDLRGQKLEELEAQLNETRMGTDEDRLRMAESLEFLRALLDANPYPVFFTDLDRRIQACNQAFARRVIGLPRQEIIGQSAEDLAESIPEALVAELQRNERQVRDTGTSLGWDARLKGPDGRTRHWAFQKEPYIDGDEVLGTVGAMIDLTGLEQAEAALVQEREQTAAVLRSAPAVIAEIHPDGTVAAVYGDCEGLLGWTPEELIGSDWWATLFPGGLRDPIRDALGAMRSGGDLTDRVLTVQTKDGEERVLSWSTSNARGADRSLQSILIVGQDTTERAREQETLELHFQESIERAKKLRCLSNALRLTQDQNLALVEVLSGIVASLPEAWRYPAITTARGSVYGRDRAFGESPHEAVASLRAPIVVSGEEVGWLEVRYHDERPEMSVGPFTTEERELLDTIAKYCGEMVERRSAEESLSTMRLFRHTLIDQANLWLMATDRDRSVVLWNRAAEQISGYARNEVIGNDRVWEMLFPDAAYRAEITQRLTDVSFGDHPLEDWETVIRAKDGTDLVVSWHAHRLVDDDGRTLGAVALGRQVTERRAAASNS
jgi:PAS domain S-box-containing protein